VHETVSEVGVEYVILKLAGADKVGVEVLQPPPKMPFQVPPLVEHLFFSISS
jgi:hypothetical protein